MVILAAAVGSYIHAATSFATYVGNKSFVASWTWWYLLRPFIGMALALVFYFVIRGGLLSVQSKATEFNPYGIAAVAGLVGIFSKQATDKLEEVFTNMFRTEGGKGDDERRDKLDDTISVTEKMLPFRRIRAVVIAKADTDQDIKLDALFKVLKEGHTRVPVLEENRVCKYIIHQSLIYKFVALKSTGGEATRISLTELDLEDLVAFEDVIDYVREAIVAVPETATLGDARAAMEKVKNCRTFSFLPPASGKAPSSVGSLTRTSLDTSRAEPCGRRVSYQAQKS